MKCGTCQKDFVTLNKYIIHIEFSHDFINNFECPIPGCHRLYNQKSSFRKHIKTKHPLSEKASCPDNKNHEIESGNETCSQINFPAKGEFDINREESTTKTESSLISDLQEKAMHFNELFRRRVENFVAKLYSINSINRITIQIFIDLVTHFLSSGIMEAIQECCSILFKTSENHISRKIICDMFRLVENPFQHLKTEYRRIQFFERSNKFVPLEPQIVGVSQSNKRKDNNVYMSLENNICYFLSMVKCLTLFLELPGVYDSILDYQKNLCNVENATFLNIVNGSLWKELKVNLENQIILPIVIYFDDFEILNPLGSHSGAYKIGAVYYTIPTIPPSYASKLENIFLTLIFYSADRTNFGNLKIFQRVIKELNYLERIGISIQVNNKTINVKFVLTAIIGDNLGLNSILGFFESFSSNHYCRICICSKDELRINIQENSSKIRSVDAYQSHLKDKIGLKEECVWNEVNNFHVYKNFYCDVMHDLFEGVHRYDMLLIINQLINKKYFSLDTLNSRIKFTTYNYFEKNIPPGFSNDQLKKKCIVISASEMLCLVRNFRFIVGDLVPENDEIWKLYLIIYDITEILTSASIQKNTLDYLHDLIAEHHTLFLKISESSLKPKFHFLTHYPQLILKIGPPMLLSCMRYEGKHADFKNIAQNVKCRKNIPYTLALKHQLKLCSRFLSGQGFVGVLDMGSLHSFDGAKFKKYVDLDIENFACTKFYEVNGVKYDTKLILLLHYNNDMPTFCQIEDILVNKNDYEIVYFYCNLWHSINFNAHYRAYEIQQSEIKNIYSIKEFRKEIPKIIHVISAKYFASLD